MTNKIYTSKSTRWAWFNRCSVFEVPVQKKHRPGKPSKTSVPEKTPGGNRTGGTRTGLSWNRTELNRTSNFLVLSVLPRTTFACQKFLEVLRTFYRLVALSRVSRRFLHGRVARHAHNESCEELPDALSTASDSYHGNGAAQDGDT